MRRIIPIHIICVLICLLLCLPLWANGAESTPGTLVVTRAFERDGDGMFLFDAMDGDGNALSLEGAELTLTLGENTAEIYAMETLREADESIATVLVLDTTYPMDKNSQARMKKAVTAWIEATRPGDRLAIVTCGAIPQMRADFVSDHALLNAVADTLVFGEEGDASLYDALRMAADLFARKAEAVPSMPARLCAVVFSNGRDTRSTKTTSEEAVALLEAQSAQVYVVCPGNTEIALQSIAPIGNVLLAGEGSLSYDEAFAALHDRILDGYRLRFSLEDRPTDGFVYVVRLSAVNAAGDLIAQGSGIFRVPQDSAKIAVPVELAGADTSSPNATPMLAEDTSPPPIVAAIAQPGGDPPASAGSSMPSPAKETEKPLSASPVTKPLHAKREGVLEWGLSIIDMVSENQQLWGIYMSVLFLGGLAIIVIISQITLKKRKLLKAFEESDGQEPPEEPTGDQDGENPAMQTNMVVRPPEYRPISAEPYTHLRQQGHGADDAPKGIRVMFRIIGPTGTVENKTLSVSDGFTIGRDISCNLYIKDPIMTKKRLSITITEEKTLIIKNIKISGILINGNKAKGDCPLASGDTLRIGRVSILVQYARELGA